MSLRVTALYLLVAGLSIYAWKDWFKSLCGLILLMAIFEHEDVPKTMYGIQGLNPWNILFVMIVLAWVFHRRWEGLRWDVPRHMVILLLLYLGVILIGVARAVGDRGNLENYPLTSLLSEELINTIKWALPGLLLFDGCRTRRRVVLALACVLGVYVVVALEVIRFMPPRAALASASALAGRRIRLGRYIGYSACDISAMLAGASWSILAALPLVRGKMRRFLMIGAAIPLENLVRHAGVGLAAIGLVTVARSVTVHSLLWGLDRLFRQDIPARWRVIVDLGGLHVGVTMAILLNLPKDLPGLEQIQVMGYYVITWSVLGLPLMFGWVIKRIQGVEEEAQSE